MAADRTSPDAAALALEDVIEALVRYLEALGYSGVTIGPARIDLPAGGGVRAEFVVPFRGRKMDAPTSDGGIVQGGPS